MPRVNLLKKAGKVICYFVIISLGFANALYSQCTIDPSAYTYRMVPVMISNNNVYDGVAMINDNGSIRVMKINGSGDKVDFYSCGSIGGLNVSKITNRVVSGDFDGDGFRDDIAALYDGGGGRTIIYVWLFTNSTHEYNRSTWWNQTGYTATRVTGRVVSGNFNGNTKDDIAAFYDYGAGETRIHVWLSNGTSFNYQGSNGWWKVKGYTASKITNRVVTGNFVKLKKYQDIAAFYDYGGGKTRLHVWKNTGSSFTYQSSSGWWSSNSFTASNITGRVVSGLFDRRDRWHDIAAFYYYGNGHTRLFIFEGSGSSFSSKCKWIMKKGYYANNITGRVINSMGHNIVAFYNYGNDTPQYHFWEQKKIFFNSYGYEYHHKYICSKKKKGTVRKR